jgi:catechol 2,3-dioxygenase-like lactoylglutathione lyase family enzyme
MITGYNHTSFTVADVDAAVSFWTDALGFKLGSLAEREGSWQESVTGINGARLRIALSLLNNRPR